MAHTKIDKNSIGLPLHTEDRDTDLIWQPTNDVKNTYYYTKFLIKKRALSGSVYVFRIDISGGEWTQHAKISPGDGAPWDLFGYSVR